MPCIIRWTPTALQDLDLFLASIAADDPERAVSVADRIDEAVHRLKDFPESAPIYRSPLRRFHVPGLPVSCYYVYTSHDVVWILYVRHDHQSPLQ
jgi:Plasmid stabilization system protein